MKRGAPLFLARRGYKYRRLADAARILPLGGAFLFLLPLLWSGGTTRKALIYLFVIWLGLIVISFWLSRALASYGGLRADRERSDDGDSGGERD